MRSSHLLCAALALSSITCGAEPGPEGPPGPPGPAGPQGPAGADPALSSGSRIKIRYVVGSDGVRTAVGLWDSLRAEECSFRLAEDGKLRCLPTPAGTLFGSNSFSDAQCTRKIVVTGAGSCPLRYGAEYTSEACAPSTMTRYYALTLVTPTPATVYVKSGEACTPSATSAASRVYAATVIPATEFVEGQLQP